LVELLDLFIGILEDGVIALYLLAVGGCLVTFAQPTGSEAMGFWFGALLGIESAHAVEGRCSLIRRWMLRPGWKAGLAAAECGGEVMMALVEHSFGRS
jgi:hypothetical protein